MYTSKALYLAAGLLAFISIYSTFSGYYLTTVKFSDSSSENLQDSKQSQWFASKGKVVMLLVDSLRFDYFVEDETNTNPLFAANKFTKFNELRAKSPNNTLVIRAKSEAPTLTIERLPCLVTGNIPPKANMLLAFGALPMSEDSILRQLIQSGRKIYFSGDPLWTEMFPNDFTEANNIRSFDLKDQDVDNITTQIIHKKLDENNFDLLLGHMLGVDHMGHSYGIGDPRVAKILNRIDNFIMEIIEKMDDETTLIVLGDHGMTNEGEHGHGSPKELDTAIAAYNKKGFQKFQQTGLDSLMKSVKETMTPTKQVDIAATLSMLLGVPVPFSNMGQIIGDLYPVTETKTESACPESNFLIQMVQDNYLNSLQIANYFEKYQKKTHLFEKHDVKAIKSMHEEVQNLHGTVMKMVKASQQCDSTFANIAINAVAKSQDFSNEVYTIVKDTSSYDLSLIYQGTGILLLAAISYILTIQYLYKHGTNEIDLKFNSKEWLISALNKSKIYLASLVIVYCVTYYFKNRMIHSVATSALYSGFWLCGSILTISFGSNPEEKAIKTEKKPKKNKEQSIQTIDESNSNSNSDADKIDIHDSSRDYSDELFIAERSGEAFSSSGFFVFKTPLYTTIAIFAVVIMMIWVHTTNFSSYNYHYIQPSAPYIVIFLLGLRLGNTFLRQLNLAFPLGIIISGSLLLLDVTLSSKGIRIVLGLIMVLDFVIHEVTYIVQHLKTKKIWGIAQFACFAVLVIYQLIPDRESYWVEIFLPRVVWAITLGIVILRCAFKIEGSAVERNFQLCLVQFLLLLQAPDNVFEYGYLLTIMRITAYFFTKAKVSNYLFPLVIGIWSHFGLFMFGHNDRWIPSKFTAGFIGLEKFNIVVSPLFVLLNILSSYVLGLLTISYYNNGIAASSHHFHPQESESSDLEKQKEGAINEISKRIAVIIQKRNVFPFVLIFNIVFLGAIIKAYVNLHYYFNESIEKFMIDATIYTFTMSCAYFLL